MKHFDLFRGFKRLWLVGSISWVIFTAIGLTPWSNVAVLLAPAPINQPVAGANPTKATPGYTDLPDNAQLDPQPDWYSKGDYGNKAVSPPAPETDPQASKGEAFAKDDGGWPTWYKPEPPEPQETEADQKADAWAALRTFGTLALIPPLSALALLYAVRWTVRGFLSQP